MKSKSNQRGLSIISVLLIAVVVIVVGLMAIRLFPVYYDSYVISSIFSEVGHKARGKSASAIRSTIERRFEVNEIDKVSIRDVKITSAHGGASDVSLQYERRVPFIGNLGIIATFKKHVRVPAH
jgi:type II secretory pathway component PulK